MIGLNHKQGGFTLVEVLIAILVLGIGVLGVESLQYHAGDANAVGRRITEATNIAASRLEVLKSLPYDDPTMLNDTDGNGVAGLDATGTTADHKATDGNYTVYWNVAKDCPVQDVETVRVIVLNNLGTQVPVKMTAVLPDIT